MALVVFVQEDEDVPSVYRNLKIFCETAPWRFVSSICWEGASSYNVDLFISQNVLSSKNPFMRSLVFGNLYRLDPCTKVACNFLFLKFDFPALLSCEFYLFRCDNTMHSVFMSWIQSRGQNYIFKLSV